MKIGVQHVGEASIQTYRRGCRCIECKGENAKYMREYMAKKRAMGGQHGNAEQASPTATS